MPSKHQNYYVLIPCDSSTKDIRKLAYGAKLKLNLSGECSKCKLAVLDCGICEMELCELLKLCSETDDISIVKIEDLKDFINGRI